MPIDAIARSLAIVDQNLRTTFPENFDQRCMYAAFGLRALLHEAQLSAEIVGGDFLCLVVAADNRQAALQGFGASASAMPSHFWVEAAGQRIDLGPHYLPRGSSFAAVPMPAVRWPLDTALPSFLRYRPRVRYHANVQLQADPEIMQRMQSFLQRCHESAQSEGAPRFPHWQLRDMATLRLAAQRGDGWAQGAMRYCAMNAHGLPLPSR